jgi:vitamin B12 transporter
MRQTGAFFQALWQLNDALELRGGLRYEDYSDYDNDWSWNLEAIYFVPDTNLSVFTKVARAYSPPNGLDIAYDANKDANNNPVNTPLNPEESLSFEIGLRQKLLDDKLEWTAVLFRNEVDNLIEYVSYPSIDTDPSNDPGQPNEDSTADLWDDIYPTDTYNAKEATLEGAEFSVDYRLNPQLRLNLGYTYLTAVAEKYISANSRFEEIRLPYRPRHLLQVSARYQPNKNLNLGLSAVSQMDRQRDQWQDYNKPTEDYFVLNFVSEYRLDDSVSLLARVENLLDEDYALTYNYPALGRSIYFGVRMQF